MWPWATSIKKVSNLDQHETRAIKRQWQLLSRLGIDSPVIYEIGANEGQSVNAYLEVIPSARIWAFEPNPALIPVLEEASGERFTVNTCAIGSGAARARLKVRSDNRVSSILEVEPELLKRSTNYRLLDEVEVEIRTIDSIWRDDGAPLPHLLRTTTCGFDLEVLRGARQALTTGDILLISSQLQFASAFVGQPQAHEIMGLLADFGYRLYGFDRLVEATSGTLYFGSGLFLSPKAWHGLGLL